MTLTPPRSTPLAPPGRRLTSRVNAVVLGFAVALGPFLSAVTPLVPFRAHQKVAFAQSVSPPVGQASVSVMNVTNVATTVNTTFSASVQVSPTAVSVDAAAALLQFSTQYLEALGVTAGTPGTDELIHETITNDGATGSVYVVLGRLAEAWPQSVFTLATVQFRVRAAAPPGATVSLILIPASGSNLNATDVAASGVSVFSGQAQSGTVTFAIPSSTPTQTPTLTPSPTRTPVPPTVTRTPISPSVTRTTAPVQATSTSVAVVAPPAAVVPAAPAVPVAPISAPAATSATVASGATSTVAAVQATQRPSDTQPLFGELGRPVVGALPPGVLPPLPILVRVAANPVAPPFEQFYADRQGLRVLGNTLAAQLIEDGIAVQYFEKGRMEAHPDEPNPAWRFQYGLLVAELAAVRAGLPVGGDASTLNYGAIHLLSLADMRTAAPQDFLGGTATLPDGSVFIPFSAALQPGPGHVVPASFWTYVNNQDLFPGGWLHDVGLPITPPVEAVVDKGPDKGRRILVQAFQRTILTYDPMNPVDYIIERANVGTDYARAFPQKFGE